MRLPAPDAVSEFFNNAAVHEKFRAVHDPDAGPVGISVGAAPDRASEERELAGLIFFFDRDAVLREDDLALSRAVGDYQLALGDLYAAFSVSVIVLPCRQRRMQSEKEPLYSLSSVTSSVRYSNRP